MNPFKLSPTNSPYQLPSTPSSHTWRVRTASSERCLLTSARHLRQSHPWSWLENTLGLSITLCNYILDFLTSRPQRVRIGSHTSSTLALNTGAPQGCVLSPLLFTLRTHDCTPTHQENDLMKIWITSQPHCKQRWKSMPGGNQSVLPSGARRTIYQGADCWFTFGLKEIVMWGFSTI